MARKVRTFEPFIAKSVKCFRVEQHKDSLFMGVKCRDTYEKDFATVDEAEARARLIVRRFGRDSVISAVDAGSGRCEHVATVLIDALDRCWTQVMAASGNGHFCKRSSLRSSACHDWSGHSSKNQMSPILPTGE
jgi:hypothetical protein